MSHRVGQFASANRSAALKRGGLINHKSLVSCFLVLYAAACSQAEPQEGTRAARVEVEPTPIATPLQPSQTPAPDHTLPSQLSDVVVACVTVSSLRVRSGPGQEFNVIGGVQEGDCFGIDGRSPDASWFRGNIPGIGPGWVSADFLDTDGDLSNLQIRDALPTPTPLRPTPTLTRRPTATTLITPAGGSGGNCHPSYAGVCLQMGIGDYDCAGGSGNGPNYVRGPFGVVGYDEFGLDRDRDGIGCE